MNLKNKCFLYIEPDGVTQLYEEKLGKEMSPCTIITPKMTIQLALLITHLPTSK
jgi:hypothetical protein